MNPSPYTVSVRSPWSEAQVSGSSPVTARSGTTVKAPGSVSEYGVAPPYTYCSPYRSYTPSHSSGRVNVTVAECCVHPASVKP